jgi:FMN phosphatase YigB (HAD superfamily)
MKIAAILFDLGDTIMIEETEIRCSEHYGISADLCPGMGDALRLLKARGYRLGIVADAHVKTVENILRQHNLHQLFEAFAISERVGVEKPDARMFLAALESLGIPPQDYGRVLMIGNNPPRDIRGANQAGLVSVWFHWNDRYPPDPQRADQPRWTVQDARTLLELVEKIDSV